MNTEYDSYVELMCDLKEKDVDKPTLQSHESSFQVCTESLNTTDKADF